MRPRAGIELDDSSHAREDRQVRDAFVHQSLTLPAWHSYVFPHSERTTFPRLQPACRPFLPKVLCRRHCHFRRTRFCTTLPEVWHSVGHSQQQPRQVLRLLELSEVPTENAPVANLVLVTARFSSDI